MRNKLLFLFTLFLSLGQVQGQTCSIPGMTPVSATLVCGDEAIGQSYIPHCGGTLIPNPCNDGNSYQNIDPYWYKIACYSSGTLGFTITPNDLNDNYDWQLFDITGHNPVDVFTVTSLFVACNYSKEVGETGANDQGTSLAICSSPGLDLFSKMPNLVAGREYLLMVSNQNRTERGFSLLFGGGSALITDGIPEMLVARTSCDGTQVYLRMNKNMQCSTIAPNGSDFMITGGRTVISAVPVSCNANNVADHLVLTLNGPLPGGYQTLTMRDGTDGNTMADHCGRLIVTGNIVTFPAAPTAPTAMDSVYTGLCSYPVIQLVFTSPIDCSSIAADGSDFRITGPQPVTIIGAVGICSNNLTPMPATYTISMRLASPVTTPGLYQIELFTGTDGNTLLNECGFMTAPGAKIPFPMAGLVSAQFNYTVKSSCKKDTIFFTSDPMNALATLNWDFGNAGNSTIQYPVIIVPSFSQHTVTLTATSPDCVDRMTKTIKLNNQLAAAFESPAYICPEDGVTFKNNSSGNVTNWVWSTNNSLISTDKDPPEYHFPVTGRETVYSVKLVAFNQGLNCGDSITHQVKVLSGCFIAVPSAFTPNGDGLNDYLFPLNAVKAEQLEFFVFNRMGQLVFQTRDWTKKWDGTVNGVLQNPGVYAWFLRFTHKDTREKIFLKGTTALIR